MAERSVILVVEDEPGVRAVVRRILERAGYTVLEAANGSEAIAIVTMLGPRIDLVLCDVRMPQLGGVEAVRQINALCPSLRIVFMSGYVDDELLHTRSPTSPPVLSKPFTPDGLVRQIQRTLDANGGDVR